MHKLCNLVYSSFSIFIFVAHEFEVIWLSMLMSWEIPLFSSSNFIKFLCVNFSSILHEFVCGVKRVLNIFLFMWIFCLPNTACWTDFLCCTILMFCQKLLDWTPGFTSKFFVLFHCSLGQVLWQCCVALIPLALWYILTLGNAISVVLFLFNIALDLYSLLWSYTNFRNLKNISVKNFIEILLSL